MVLYGNSLRLARRSGWEEAYIDYDKLQDSLRKIDELFHASVPVHQDEQQSREERTPLIVGHIENAHGESLFSQLVTLGQAFMMELQSEIEKVSLFYLKKQGELADIVGAVRFNQSLSTAVFRTTADLALLLSNQGVSLELSNKKDIFAVLGVELLHLLRFICINATAVRKILKKYRKLILNIIHAINNATLVNYIDNEIQDLLMSDMQLQASTVNALDSLSYAKPTRFSLDDHLQQLVNSGTIDAIQASFYAALNDNNDVGGDYTTEPNTATLRLEFVLVSIQTIREKAEIINHSFRNLISRKAMIATGTNLGDIEGSTLDALHMLLRFEPDSIWFMSQDDLSQWYRMMKSGKPMKKMSREQSHQHFQSMSGIPMGELKKQDEDVTSKPRKRTWGGVDTIALVINLVSVHLYTVNYYIVAPNANNYAMLLGHDGAYGATLIGASSFAALFAAFFYSIWYTKFSFKSALLFSSICPLLGNLLYALAVSYRSLAMALAGRILCGFGSAEVVNRQLISACVSFDRMTSASALFVAAGAVGMSVGPLLGSVFDMLAGRDLKVDLRIEATPVGGLVYNFVTAPGFFMALLWFIQLCFCAYLFIEPHRINGSEKWKSPDRSDSERKSSFAAAAMDGTAVDGSFRLKNTSYVLIDLNSERDLDSTNGGMDVQNRSAFQVLLAEMHLTRSLVFGKPALPVTLLLFCYIEMADEVLISSCSMITRRYFGWHGSSAGFVIACLGALVLPANFVVERASDWMSERKIMKYSIVFIICSLIAIMNFQGLFYDLMGSLVVIESNDHGIGNIKHDVVIDGTPVSKLLVHGEFPYDWGIGKFIYITFLSAIFMGTIVLEGVDTSLMAKVTPAKLNHSVFNSGLLATLIGTLGRVLADFFITMGALLDVFVLIDFVSAIYFPLLVLAIGAYFLVLKYFHHFLVT